MKRLRVLDLQSYRHLCRVHEPQSKVVSLYNVQVVHDLIKQLLAFGFFLIREAHKQHTSDQSDKLPRYAGFGKTNYPFVKK